MAARGNLVHTTHVCYQPKKNYILLPNGHPSVPRYNDKLNSTDMQRWISALAAFWLAGAPIEMSTNQPLLYTYPHTSSSRTVASLPRTSASARLYAVYPITTTLLC